MNEATCKGRVVRLLRDSLAPRGGVVFRHEDQFTGGIPDVSLSLGGRTVWAEFKLHRPGRKARTTDLQTAALTALHGVLVEYTVHPTGLTAVLWDVVEGRPIAMALAPSRSGAVHNVVAGTLLSRLERGGR